jgi:hypothetical protein
MELYLLVVDQSYVIIGHRLCDSPPPPREHPSNRLVVLKRYAWKSAGSLQVISPMVSTVRVKPVIGGWVLEQEQADSPAVVPASVDEVV